MSAASGLKSLVRKSITTSFYGLLIFSNSIIDIIDEVVRQVNPSVKWKILVVDQHALRIINAAVKMNELMDENITRKCPVIYYMHPIILHCLS